MPSATLSKGSSNWQASSSKEGEFIPQNSKACHLLYTLASLDQTPILVVSFRISMIVDWLTLARRFIPRPHSCSLTCASFSLQVVTHITTVGGCLSKCCSSSVTNLTIFWVSQGVAVYNC